VTTTSSIFRDPALRALLAAAAQRIADLRAGDRRAALSEAAERRAVGVQLAAIATNVGTLCRAQRVDVHSTDLPGGGVEVRAVLAPAVLASVPTALGA
jgi:hypothetical protein